MRVLVASIPGVGHLRPMAPILRAMVEGGDQVTVAANPAVADQVAHTGAALWPAGSDEPTWFERLSARTRGAPGEGIAAARIDHYFVPRAFGEIGTDDMVDDVLACAEATDPELVVFESYAFVGPLVAAIRGVPQAQHTLGPLLEPDVLELANDAVSPLWRSFGLDAPGYAGVYEGATIALCPPSLHRGDLPRGRRLELRPSPLPVSPPHRGARPLVYVTLGTFFGANHDVVVTILDGLAGEPLDVLVTLGADGDPTALGPLPANVTVERFVPQADVLPRCAAVVHHGGSGTTFGALAHGLPQVVVPQGADNFRNAALLDGAGASRTVLPEARTPAAVRTAVRDVLDEPRFAAAAQRLATEIDAMPTPEALADSLRDLAASPR